MRFILSTEKSRGSLVGLAIGDALGAPLEGSPHPEAWVTEMLSGGRHFRKTGQFTDDTLQALAVAESLVSCKGFDQTDLVKRLLANYERRPEWYGPTSSGFFSLVKKGTLPHHASWLVHRRQHGSRSNGSVMRGFPIGIFYRAKNANDVSIACSHITHFDPVAAHCSAWLNVMVSDMCRGLSRQMAYGHARSLCRHGEVFARLGNFEHYMPEPSLDSVLCSHAALASFMNAKTFEHAVLSAINLGGDADTVGACTGALAGAFWGVEAIPARWKTKLEEYDNLVQLADALWQERDE